MRNCHWFAVIVSDPARPKDRVVEYWPSEEQARAHVRRLNALAIEECGRPGYGNPVRLYYAVDTVEDGTATLAKRTVFAKEAG